ncbi:MAG TPA: hypothetical protein VGO11_14325 [Chthoniobacteraceae bacterium]|jgi:hypothetical protein|nr:hypothetical protein [Chthoniobacteraceae bacterium]
MAVFSAAVMRTDSDVPLLGIGLGLAAAFALLFFVRRCPCGGRLIPREEPVPGEIGRCHLFYDCSRCRTVWDSGKMVEEEAGEREED